MAQGDLDTFDDVVTGAGDSLVASIIMLIAAFFAFILTAVMIQLISGISRTPVTGDFLALSAAIVTAAVLLASVMEVKE